MTPGSLATQKGDVYSFAIILEEIVLRGGPYEVARTYMIAQEVKIFVKILNIGNIQSLHVTCLQIVNRVAASETPPFRPEVAQKECPADILSLMEKCWNEVPEERPTFHVVRGTIRGIMKFVANFLFNYGLIECCIEIYIYIFLILEGTARI